MKKLQTEPSFQPVSLLTWYLQKGKKKERERKVEEYSNNSISSSILSNCQNTHLKQSRKICSVGGCVQPWYRGQTPHTHPGICKAGCKNYPLWRLTENELFDFQACRFLQNAYYTVKKCAPCFLFAMLSLKNMCVVLWKLGQKQYWMQ